MSLQMLCGQVTIFQLRPVLCVKLFGVELFSRRSGTAVLKRELALREERVMRWKRAGPWPKDRQQGVTSSIKRHCRGTAASIRP